VVILAEVTNERRRTTELVRQILELHQMITETMGDEAIATALDQWDRYQPEGGAPDRA
jgi:hypothetical protein